MTGAAKAAASGEASVRQVELDDPMYVLKHPVYTNVVSARGDRRALEPAFSLHIDIDDTYPPGVVSGDVPC